jgi:ABC-type glycerol-3-phosphate transport system permease component
MESTKSSFILNYKPKLLKWKNKPAEILWKLFRTLLITGICFVIIYPILLKISVAIKSSEDLYNPTVMLIPLHYTLDNFRVAIHVMDYFNAIRTTFLVSLIAMILQTVSCALAGYGFARFEFKGRNILFAMVILTILVPAQTLVVPMYLHLKNFDILGIIHLFTGKDGISLINTYWPTAILSMTANGLKSGLYIYIFRQFFKGMPKEIEEAALIDGAGGFATFYKIMLPNSLSPIITVMLFAFVWQWNDTFFSSMFMSQMHLLSTALSTISSNTNVYLGSLNGGDPNYRADPNLIMMTVDTGILLGIAPLLLLYIFVQRFFVESVERSGVVG